MRSVSLFGLSYHKNKQYLLFIKEHNPKNVSIEEFNDYIQLKILRVENLIEYCQNQGLKTCEVFLKNAKDQLFTVGRNVRDNHNTSLIERAMRTIKQRTKYACWSEKGVENAIKVRLNHFYNQKI